MRGVKQGPKSEFDAGAAASSGADLRVLLAEDTPINAEAMKAMSEHLAVKMDVAGNGLEAIEMVEAAEAAGHSYSLLLVDVMMPILDGIETAIRLRAMGYDAQKLPIIAVTAAISFDEIRTYRASGMQAFLAKPIALKDLRATYEAWGHTSRPKSRKQRAKIEPAILKALSQQFNDRNQRTLTLIEDALGERRISAAVIDEIRNLLHQIAGTATTFEDAALSDIARDQEHVLIEAQAAGKDVRPGLEKAARALRERVVS